MTDSDNELEAMLRRLPRRTPSTEMDRRIDASVRRPPLTRQRVRWYAVAASVLIVIGMVTLREHSKTYKPVAEGRSVATTGGTSPALIASTPLELETTTSRTIDDGIFSEDGVPYRQLRRQTVREYWIVDPATGASARVRVPSEQLLVTREETF